MQGSQSLSQDAFIGECVCPGVSSLRVSIKHPVQNISDAEIPNRFDIFSLHFLGALGKDGLGMFLN